MLVTTVRAGTVAAKAGLQFGDVITAVDGQPVTEAGELRRRIDAVKDGEAFSIAVTRARSSMSLTARFEEQTPVRVRPERPI